MRKRLIIAAGFLVLVGFLFLIGLGKQGAVDLYQLKLQRDHLKKNNSALQEKNQVLYRTIRRLKEDPSYVENIARTEFGMTREDEVVILRKKP